MNAASGIGCLLVLIWLTIGPPVNAGPPVETEPPRIAYRIGTAADTALDAPLFATWSNAPLRGVLARLSETQRVAILLDRRVDPETEVSLELTGQSLRSGLERIAEAHNLTISRIGSTVMLGPPESVGKLRTLAVLRDRELRLLRNSVPVANRFALSSRTNQTWGDLTDPETVAAQVTERIGFTAPELPHDLWARGGIAGCSPAETLSILLVQFDRTFRFDAASRSIVTLPIPEKVTVTETVVPRRISTAEAIRAWPTEVPGVTVRGAGRGLLVTGTVEQIEAVRELAKGSRTAPGTTPMPNPPAGTPSVPLSRRQFTLKIRGVPANALIAKLQTSGMTIRYDAAALTEANIDLTRRIDIDVTQASAEEFFRAVCDPLGLTFTIDGTTVTLGVK